MGMSRSGRVLLKNAVVILVVVLLAVLSLCIVGSPPLEQWI